MINMRFKNILIFLVLLQILLLLPCKIVNAQMAMNEKDILLKAFNNAHRKVIGLEFKELEEKGARELFDEYKKVKSEIIKSKILGDDYKIKLEQLYKIRNMFNKRSLSKNSLSDVEQGYRENQYISRFECLFIRNFIMELDDNLKVDVKSLKIFFEG